MGNLLTDDSSLNMLQYERSMATSTKLFVELMTLLLILLPKKKVSFHECMTWWLQSTMQVAFFENKKYTAVAICLGCLHRVNFLLIPCCCGSYMRVYNVASRKRVQRKKMYVCSSNIFCYVVSRYFESMHYIFWPTTQ